MPFVRVRGRSMVPTLRPGDILWAGPPKRLQRGDIVIVDKTALMIKRIIGLPGETVALESGRVSIDRHPLPESYVPENASLQPQKDQTFQLPSSHYLVLGDARDDSLDSRRLGPVAAGDIKGVVRRRFWPLAQWGRVALAVIGFFWGGLARAQDGHARLLAFASETRLVLMIGKYDSKNGWVNATDFYQPPQPGDVFTLYGPTGLVGDVTITEDHRENPDGVFAGWSAKVSHWDYRQTPFALAVSGPPLPTPVLESIPLDNAEYRKIVANYLHSKGLRVDQPLLTQVVYIPIEGHGREEAVLVAHSDESTLSDAQPADIYAVVLLWWNDHGKENVWPLASKTSHKPAGRSVEEDQRYHGVRPFYRMIGAVDVDGDGWKEIAIYAARTSATEVNVFRFDGWRPKKVLSAWKANDN